MKSEGFSLWLVNPVSEPQFVQILTIVFSDFDNRERRENEGLCIVHTLITSVLYKQYWYFVRPVYDIFLDRLFTGIVYFHIIVQLGYILRHTFSIS